MPKHSPGPFTVEQNTHPLDKSFRINCAKGYALAGTYGRDGKGEEEANGQLLGASADMAEALQMFLCHSYDPAAGRRKGYDRAARDMAIAALKKAGRPYPGT